MKNEMTKYELLEELKENLPKITHWIEQCIKFNPNDSRFLPLLEKSKKMNEIFNPNDFDISSTELINTSYYSNVEDGRDFSLLLNEVYNELENLDLEYLASDDKGNVEQSDIHAFICMNCYYQLCKFSAK